ncbi:MAG: hypothetical protein ABH887_01070 [bacterium]
MIGIINKLNKKIIITLFLLLIIVSLVIFFSKKNKKIEVIGGVTPEETFLYAAQAIENEDADKALEMFNVGAHNKVRNLINELDKEGRQKLSQSLRSAQRSTEEEFQTETFKVFNTKMNVKGFAYPINIQIEIIALPNGNWVILNL